MDLYADAVENFPLAVRPQITPSLVFSLRGMGTVLIWSTISFGSQVLRRGISQVLLGVKKSATFQFVACG